LKNNRSNQAKSLEGAIRRKLGYQALKNKKTNEAIENFNRLNSLGGMNASDQYNLVVAKLQSNKIQHPEETLEKFARQNIPEAVLNYAIYLDSAGDAVKATRYYEKYVSMANAKKAESVREMLETKQRVWGESE
jgi:tetratricopeptide (TPR) repeat protein